MKKEVMLVTGAGQISMAIARHVGFGKKIIRFSRRFFPAALPDRLLVAIALSHPADSKG